ncbi:MAG TPA: hypothetical protein VNN79_01890 [Actinomycetota bacterium]|nr:hypothetical protein [Actinomycetota bacterium]
MRNSGRPRAPVAIALAACLMVLAAGCTGGSPDPGAGTSGARASAPGRTPGTTGGGDFRLPAPATGRQSAAEVQRRLCARPPEPTPAPAPTQATTDQPPIVLDTEQRVQEYRELTYLAPVPIDSVTPAELRTGLEARFDREYPADLMARRSRAWSTVGVVPAGIDLRDAFHRYVSAEQGASYDVDTNVLSLVEHTDLEPIEHFGLVHELAAALDDQRFAEDRADHLLTACDDEAWMGAQGAMQGSAGFFATQVALRTFATGDQSVADPAVRLRQPAGVPPFVHAIRVFPDVQGPTFAATITDLGETEAINEPLSSLPVSTEQILHPADRLEDPPVAVDVPDLGPALGTGWRDLDVMEVGEEWLRAMLALRLDPSDADAAAEGWGGGRYRAWTDGSDSAVMLVTDWDTPKDAAEFETAMRQWIGDGSTAVTGTTQDPSTVVSLFATDPAALTAMEQALR